MPGESPSPAGCEGVVLRPLQEVTPYDKGYPMQYRRYWVIPAFLPESPGAKRSGDPNGKRRLLRRPHGQS